MSHTPQLNLEETFARIHTSMDTQFQTFQANVTNQFTQLHNEIITLRSDMEQGFTHVQDEMSQWRTYMDQFGHPPS